MMTTERVTVDGEQYAPTTFEEPGDWPEEVEKLEREWEEWRNCEFKRTPDEIAQMMARRRDRDAMLKEPVRNFVFEAYHVAKEHVCQARRERSNRRRICRPSRKNSLSSSSAAQ